MAFRTGKKVVHKYLGSTVSSKVIKLVENNNEIESIPQQLKYLFWDTSLDKIHLKKNSQYIIERVLELGDFYALDWLQRVYPTQKIINVLAISRNISEKSDNFWKVWFGINDA